MPQSNDKVTPKNRADKLRTKASVLRQKAEAMEKEAIALVSPTECKEAARRIARGKGKIALFLGAGASKSFGWPLTSELFPLILKALMEKTLFEDHRINSEEFNAEDRAHLKRTLKALCPGLQLDDPSFIETNKQRLPLVTSHLSMLDFSLISGQALVPGLTPDQIKAARMLLERAIYEVIEHEEKATGRYFWPLRKPNARTKQLVNWLDNIRARSQIGFITSNYDAAIEKVWGFERDDINAVKNLALDFGFDWLWPSNDREETIPRPHAPQRRLYKLHGSTNWLRCGLCDRVYINPEVDIAVYAYARKASANNKCH